MQNNKISVLLLAQNSQRTIKRCLDSLVKFDEIVLIDGGSTDETLVIANQYKNVKIIKHKWNGFIEQRNTSLTHASHEWSFMIDSDEAATPELVDKLYQIANDSSNNKVMFQIMRTEYYCDTPIENGFGASTYQQRFFQTSRITYCGGVHHNHLIDKSPIPANSALIEYIDPKIRILHDKDYKLRDWIEKIPRFTSCIANEKIAAGKKTNELLIILTLLLTFFKIYLKSWKNGRVGFLIAVQEAIYKTLVKLIIYQKINIKPKNSSLTKKR